MEEDFARSEPGFQLPYYDYLFFVFVPRYLGDGPKLVRELFRVADEMSPTLVFIDEIDAVGSKRYDSNSGGTREIQRTMLELLNQLDGFDERGDVKVCFMSYVLGRTYSRFPSLVVMGSVGDIGNVAIFVVRFNSVYCGSQSGVCAK